MAIPTLSVTTNTTSQISIQTSDYGTGAGDAFRFYSDAPQTAGTFHIGEGGLAEWDHGANSTTVSSSPGVDAANGDGGLYNFDFGYKNACTGTGSAFAVANSSNGAYQQVHLRGANGATAEETFWGIWASGRHVLVKKNSSGATQSFFPTLLVMDTAGSLVTVSAATPGRAAFSGTHCGVVLASFDLAAAFNSTFSGTAGAGNNYHGIFGNPSLAANTVTSALLVVSGYDNAVTTTLRDALSADYRTHGAGGASPATNGLLVTTGTGVTSWTDVFGTAVTSRTSFYDEQYAAYRIQAATNHVNVGSATASQWGVDGTTVTKRYKPAFIISSWTDAGATPTVTLGGTALVSGTDFVAYNDTTNSVLWLVLNKDLAGTEGALDVSAAGGGSTPVTTTDTGTGTDTGAIGVYGAESGAGSDLLSLVATITILDSGTGAETILIAVPLSEAGTGTDTPLLTASLPTADSGAGADATTLTAAAASTDAGTGTDAGAISLLSSDAGTGVDNPLLTASASSGESGTGTDSGRLGLVAGESGAAVDAPGLVAATASGETGAGTDTSSLRLAATESGTGGDTPTLTATTTTGESGAGTDTASSNGNAAITATEAGSAGDSGLLTATSTTSEGGSGADTATTGAPISAGESGSGVDSATGRASLTGAESGSSVDALPTLGVGLTFGDLAGGADNHTGTMTALFPESGTGSDTGSTGVPLSMAEAGAGSDGATIPLQSYTLTETGTASDTLAVAVMLALAEIAAALEHLSVGGQAIVIRAAYRALARTTQFAASARLTQFMALARPTQFRSMGDVDMPMQPITQSLQPAVLRSGDTKEVFSGDFALDLATGETLTGCTFTVKAATAMQPGSIQPIPGATWSDVTASVAVGGTVNPSPSSSSGAYVGAVATGTGGAVSVAQTSGLGYGVPGMTYNIYYFVTTSTGRTLMDAIAGQNGMGGLVADM